MLVLENDSRIDITYNFMYVLGIWTHASKTRGGELFVLATKAILIQTNQSRKAPNFRVLYQSFERSWLLAFRFLCRSLVDKRPISIVSHYARLGLKCDCKGLNGSRKLILKLMILLSQGRFTKLVPLPNLDVANYLLQKLSIFFYPIHSDQHFNLSLLLFPGLISLYNQNRNMGISGKSQRYSMAPSGLFE